MQNLSQLETNFPPFIVDKSLSTNFNHCTNPNLIIFSSLTEAKAYVPISAYVLEHIITTNNLTNHEKLYYIIADSLALINKKEGGARVTSLSSEKWAIRLGCSRSLVFTMQKSLEEKGYFIINKNFDKIGRNKRNLITPTLPTSVFTSLNAKYQNKIKQESLEELQLHNSSAKCRRTYFDKTQLFIKLNYNLLKAITSNKHLNSQQKVIWLGFYTRCYKNYMSPMAENANLNKYSNNIDSSFSCVASYKELADYYSYNIKHLSKSIKALEEASFIKAQHFYIREKRSGNNTDENYSNNQGGGVCGDNDCYYMQERQDKSLWKITLLLPDDYTCELKKLKDRANFNLNYSNAKVIAANNSVNSEVVQHYLSQKSSLIPVDDTYVDLVIEEMDIEDKIEVQEPLENIGFSGEGIKSDPSFAKSTLLLNKNLKQNINSNLEEKIKVPFCKFLEKKNQKGKKKFNITSELIRQKIKELPKEKAEKARKFAYSLTSKKLTKGYAESLSKHELAKQILFHAVTWKPTKLGSISREKEIDTALSVAWRSVENGTWKIPLEWEKAQILQAEFDCYAQKYKESGIFSNELRSLESATNKLLKTDFIDLKSKIIEQVGVFVSEFNTTHNKGLVPITEANNYNDYGTSLVHKKDIELLPFPKEKEVYLSCSDLHNKNSIDSNNYHKNYNKNLISYESYEDIDTICETEKEYKANRMLELSSLSAQEKYLRMTCLDANNEMIIKTVNDNEYLFKYKAMECNSEGEVAIILEKTKLQSFITDLNNELLTKNSNILVNNNLSNNLHPLTDSRKKEAYTSESLSNNLNSSKDSSLMENRIKGFNVSVQKTLQIDNNTKTNCSINDDAKTDHNYIVDHKKQVPLKEFLNTKPVGHKPLESEIDIVFSCIVKNL